MKIVKSTLLLSLILALFACNNSAKEDVNEASSMNLNKLNHEELNKEIEKREAALNTDTSNMDSQKAVELMEAYALYEKKFPKKEDAADRLFKAGELAMGLGKTVESIKYFDKLYVQYENYEKRPYALFMKAFVLENQVAKYDQAKETYEQFIVKYPDHPMADDAQYSIDNMGKSPEELIREFEKKDSLRKAQAAA